MKFQFRNYILARIVWILHLWLIILTSPFPFAFHHMLHFTRVMHDSRANVNFVISNGVLERLYLWSGYMSLLEWLYVIAISRDVEFTWLSQKFFQRGQTKYNKILK